MMNLFKILKLSNFLIFFIACNSSSSFDDENLNLINEDIIIGENQNLNTNSSDQTQFTLLAEPNLILSCSAWFPIIEDSFEIEKYILHQIGC